MPPDMSATSHDITIRLLPTDNVAEHPRPLVAKIGNGPTGSCLGTPAHPRGRRHPIQRRILVPEDVSSTA